MGTLRGRLNYANVMSTIAVFIALGGTSYAVARNSVGALQLKPNAVTSIKVKDRSLRTADLSRAARLGLRGPRGPQGPAGPPGSAGSGSSGVSADLKPEAWEPLSRIGGWENYPSYEAAGYRKDRQGQVHLRGVVQHRDTAASTSPVIGVLPAGYRPLRRQIFTSNGGDPSTYTRVDLTPDGAITWVVGPTSDPSYATSLSGMSFWPD